MIKGIVKYIRIHLVEIVFYSLGAWLFVVGVLIMDGYVEPYREANIETAIGLSYSLGGVMITMMWTHVIRYKHIQEELSALQDRIDYLEDLMCVEYNRCEDSQEWDAINGRNDDNCGNPKNRN